MQGGAAAAMPKRDYGAVELKRIFQRNWVVGFGIAVVLHFAVIGAYYAAGLLTEEEPPVVTVRILKYSDLGPPPSIAHVPCHEDSR